MEIYNNEDNELRTRYDLRDVAREGLIKLCSEGFRSGNQILIDASLEKLKTIDSIKTEEQLTILRTEIDNLLQKNESRG